MLLKLHESDSGEIIYKGENITKYSNRQMKPLRKEMQIIFQDPYASLNPRMTTFQSMKVVLDNMDSGSESDKEKKICDVLGKVSIGKQYYDKYPHELSGGQRQRIDIARAVLPDPGLVVCDEPVSALDVSVRSQVLNLMKKLQKEGNMAYLFISHDLSVVRYLCDRVAVMYLGRIVEIGSKEDVFEHTAHPYTEALMSAIPIPDVHVKKELIALSGDVPSPVNHPSGCRFHTRCPYATEKCKCEEPSFTSVSQGHMVACHFPIVNEKTEESLYECV
jgi:peptide/nickel transport system ATP-binding protein/oligopeptide transport system ATP-binding protein